jgi:nucleotide-binding universal stress UspA family protein
MRVIGDQVGLTLDRIVFATDFSPSAERAAGYAQGLAKRFSSSLSLAHVVDLSVTTRLEPAVVGIPIEAMRCWSAEKQERLLNDMTSAGVRTSAHTLEAHNPAQALVAFTKELRADLIVTGTNARHGLSKAILGSCAEGLIRHASCPVLTIGPKVKRAPKGGFSFHTVVFATDFSSNAAREAAVALSFAEDSVARIYLCHVLDHPGKDICETVDMELKFEQALQRLIPPSAYDWIRPEGIVETGEVAPRILALAVKVNADLIVLGAKHSGTWYTHLAEGTIGQVLAGAECPVLTVCAS